MRKLFQVTIASALSALLVVIVVANAQPGVGFSRSADFSGTGSSGSPMEMSSDVTMPGKLFVAGAAGSTTITAASTNRDTIAATRTATTSTDSGYSAVLGTNTGTFNTTSAEVYAYGVRGVSSGTRSSGANSLNNYGVMGLASGGQNTIGAIGAVTGGTDAAGVLGLSDAAGTVAYGLRGNARGGATTNYGVYGTSSGGGTNYSGYFDSGLFHVEGASDFDDDATFEDDVCVINSLGITCGGTLMTPGADITSVTAGTGLTGGGSSGAVTLDVGCSTGLSCGADTVTLNMTGASCSGNQVMTALGATGTGTCAAPPSFTNVAAGYAPASGGGTANFLRADGTWTAPAGAGDVTDVNVSATSPITSSSSSCSSGTCATTISTSIATSRIVGRTTAGTGVMEELTGAQATALLSQASTVATTQGVVPGSNGATTAFLRGDMTWATVSAGITNSASANYYAKSDGTNIGNGTIKDDGTSITFNTTAGGSTAKMTYTVASGNLATDGSLTVNNAAGGSSDFTVKKQTSGNAFSVASASGNTIVGGTFSVTGTASFSSTTTIENSQLLDVKDRLQAKFISGDDSTPTLSSCGTSPTIDANSNNLAGKFTTGGFTGTTCDITFDGTWSPAHPWCIVWKVSDGQLVPPNVYTESTTVLSISSGLNVSTDYRYMCLGGN